MIRKFYITNSLGQTQTLTDRGTNVFLNDPSGLGYTNSLTTVDRVNALSLISADQGFGTISGEVIFHDPTNAGRYAQYNDFIKFLTYTPLTFYYVIPTEPAQTFNCDVELLSIEKSEVETQGIMRCQMSLQMLSRWKGAEVVVTGTGNTYTLTNDGHMPVGFEITISGDISNVRFSIEQNGETYGSAKFINPSAQRVDSIYVNSRDNQQDIVIVQNGAEVGNPYSYQDLSISNGNIYVTFLKLARGESTLTVSSAGTLSSVEIRYTPLYRSV